MIRLRRWCRIAGTVALNVWLCFHVLGVVVTPATVGPSSGSVRRAWEYVGPYLQVLYLNHGFHFFAPEPGGSNLLEYELHYADGTVERERIPNRDIGPRLLYHRHFMLTEVLGNSSQDLQPKIAHTYAAQLLRKHDAKAVRLTLVRHELSRMVRIRAGGVLEDEELYSTIPLGTYRASD